MGAGTPLAAASARFSRHDAQITEGQGEILDGEGGGTSGRTATAAAVHHAIHVFLAPVDFSARGHVHTTTSERGDGGGYTNSMQ